MATSSRLLLGSLVASAALAPAALGHDALAGGVGAGEETPTCDAYDVEYALSANLELTDTPMGQGDGVYRIGPGSAVVRYDAHGPGAKLLAYTMTERFRIESKTLFWSTTVTTDSRTTTGADACGVVAAGNVSGRSLGWTSDIHGYRTDGTLTCDGSLCGKFGAPPAGRSALHVAPHDVKLHPFELSADTKTFSMSRTWVSHSDAPKQTAFVALSGREVRRTCVRAPITACAPHAP